MSTPTGFIGIANGHEIYGVSEYDPLGKTVTISNYKTITRWHLIEAIENIHDADVDFLCNLARKNGNTAFGQAVCWNYLMEVVKKYWADAEKRIEGERAERDCSIGGN